jgi:hypothetical protein
MMSFCKTVFDRRLYCATWIGSSDRWNVTVRRGSTLIGQPALRIVARCPGKGEAWYRVNLSCIRLSPLLNFYYL